MKKLIIFAFVLLPLYSIAQIITTVAGTGFPGDTGDGGSAGIAKINYPTYVVFDSKGNYYFSESSQNKVRKVSTCGIITTIAGNGIAGFSGDGFPATAAELNFPEGVAIDTAGNLYIPDPNNNRVRKIDAITGIITTIAGNGSVGYSGDGVPATATSLNGPADIACDNFGNLFISDHLNNRIRKIDQYGIITTYAGTGTAGFSGDGGKADTAKINSPVAIICDTKGNIYFSDNNNDRIRKISVGTQIISTVAGDGTIGFYGDGGPATSAKFWYGGGAMAVDVIGNLYIADENNQRVRKVDVTGIITTIVGTGTAGFSGDGFPATAATIYDPEGLACNSAGNLFIADFANNRIRKVTYNGSDTLSISLSGPVSAMPGTTVTITAAIVNAGGSYLIHWLNHGTEFTVTTVPSVTYTKATGTDTITARIVPISTGCYDSITSTGYVVTDMSKLMAPGRSKVVKTLYIYPNPVGDVLYVDMEKAGNTAYQLMDMVGRVVQQGTLHTGDNSVPVKELPRGVYVMEVNGGERVVSKIVKE